MHSPTCFCKVFEDNSGALELAQLLKLRQQTKNINMCYHHFRKHVGSRRIKIVPNSTKDQIADTLTKALPRTHSLSTDAPCVGNNPRCQSEGV